MVETDPKEVGLRNQMTYKCKLFLEQPKLNIVVFYILLSEPSLSKPY
jgi:hypothetical protein